MKLVLVISVLAVGIQGYKGIWNLGNLYCKSHDVNLTQRVQVFSAKEAEQATKFWLCTRRNKDLSDSQELKINRTDLLQNSHFNALWPVRFVIHGIINHKHSDVNIKITEAYLKKGDYNVIVVDWADLSESILKMPDFDSVAESIKYLGGILADFAMFLSREVKVSFENMYLIGHRLGAQIAGFAGAKVKPTHQFRTIYALEPAAPRRLINLDDAYYIESIQTDVFSYDGSGFRKPVGHASFYPNFGRTQPGCSDTMSSCSHDRSYEYFAESITSDKPFYGQECLDFEEVRRQHCTSPNRSVIMGGEPAQKKHFGIFYVRTNGKPPYRLEP